MPSKTAALSEVVSQFIKGEISTWEYSRKYQGDYIELMREPGVSDIVNYVLMESTVVHCIF